MKTYKRYPPEIRERAVRLVLEHQEHYRSEWAALTAITEDHVSHSTVILFDHRAQFPLWNQPYRSGKGFSNRFQACRNTTRLWLRTASSRPVSTRADCPTSVAIGSSHSSAVSLYSSMIESLIWARCGVSHKMLTES